MDQGMDLGWCVNATRDVLGWLRNRLGKDSAWAVHLEWLCWLRDGSGVCLG